MCAGHVNTAAARLLEVAGWLGGTVPLRQPPVAALIAC